MNVFVIFGGDGRLHAVEPTEEATDALLFVLQLDHPTTAFSVLDLDCIGAN